MAIPSQELAGKIQTPSFARPGFSALEAMSTGLNGFFLLSLLMLPFAGIAGWGATRLKNPGAATAANKAAGFFKAPTTSFGEMKHTSGLCNFANKTLHMDISPLTLTSAASLGMSAVSTAGLVKGFAENISIIKHMCRDIGYSASTWDVIRGHVPEPVKAMHKQVFHKQGIASLMEVGLTGLSMAMMLGKTPSFISKGLEKTGLGDNKFFGNPLVQAVGMNMALSGLYQVPGMIAKTSHNAIAAYKAAHQAVAVGTQISPELYTHLVASSGLHPQYGGALIEEFYKAQTPPGGVIKRLHELALQTQPKQVVGSHTAREMARRSIPLQQQQLSFSPT